MPGNWRIEGVGGTGSDLLSMADGTGNLEADSPLITIVLGFRWNLFSPPRLAENSLRHLSCNETNYLCAWMYKGLMFSDRSRSPTKYSIFLAISHLDSFDWRFHVGRRIFLSTSKRWSRRRRILNLETWNHEKNVTRAFQTIVIITGKE